MAEAAKNAQPAPSEAGLLVLHQVAATR